MSGSRSARRSTFWPGPRSRRRPTSSRTTKTRNSAPLTRVAALYDVHGNLPALEAVLAEVEREAVDLLVFGGDMASGPLPRETLDRIMALDALAIRGNADRELLERGGRGLSDDWVASQLVPRHEEWLRSLPETIELDVEQVGTVLFCHGSPRSDEEMMLRTTPEERLLELVDGVEADLVVCGHTHMQFDRKVGHRRVVNAGSVGLPYGAPGAHWLLLGPGLEHRQTDYDVDAAAERLLAGGWPQAPKLVEENVRRVPSEEEALSFFEPLAKEHGWF